MPWPRCASTCRWATRWSRAATREAGARGGQPRPARVRAGPAGQIHLRGGGPAGRGRTARRRAGRRGTRWAVGRARGDAEAVMDRAGDILRFYTEQFGPCPYPLLNLAVTEGLAPGGHSPPGMIVLVQRPLLLRRGLRDDPANFSDVPGFFLAHELAHQWWGHGVAGQNYRERWISEALRPVRGRALGPPGARRADVPRHDEPDGALGPAHGATAGPSTSATASATSRATPRSTARSSTTRAPTSCTCCAASWATRPSGAR